MVTLIELSRRFDCRSKALHTHRKTARRPQIADHRLTAIVATRAPSLTGNEMNSTLAAKTGLAHADADDGHGEQPAKPSRPTASSEAAQCLTIFLSKRHAGRRRHLAEQRIPRRPAAGTGVRVVATERSYTQEASTNGNSLDLAIQGRVSSRCCSLTEPSPIPATVTSRPTRRPARQFERLPDQPAITIPTGAQSITIGTDGVVSVQIAGKRLPRRWVPCSWPISSIRPGCNGGWKTCWSSPPPADPRPPAIPVSPVSATLVQGSVEASKRECRSGNGRHDPNPARLRDELKGDPDHDQSPST